MKTIFDNHVITYSEFEYFKSLPNSSKVNYMFELFEPQLAKTGINLNTFFELIHDISFYKQDLIVDQLPDKHKNAVDVTIDEDKILIETNNLRALRTISYRFIESGYILRRDLILEKQYRKRKAAKYMRIFHIINHDSSICPN